MKRINQAGSHVVAIALVVAALGVVAFAGYTVSHRSNKADSAQTAAQKDTTSSAIQSKADLQQTSTSLANTSSDLDSSVDGSTLDASIDDLL